MSFYTELRILIAVRYSQANSRMNGEIQRSRTLAAFSINVADLEDLFRRAKDADVNSLNLLQGRCWRLL